MSDSPKVFITFSTAPDITDTLDYESIVHSVRPSTVPNKMPICDIEGNTTGYYIRIALIDCKGDTVGSLDIME